jgi:hypothetical protein
MLPTQGVSAIDRAGRAFAIAARHSFRLRIDDLASKPLARHVGSDVLNYGFQTLCEGILEGLAFRPS